MLLAAGFAATLAVVPLMTTDAATAAPRHSSALAAGTFENAPCAVDVPLEHEDDVRCGYLTVPERRDAGADPERTLRLPVAIVSSRAKEPAADPLVFPTSGGPGGGSLAWLSYFLDDAYWANTDRDVILVEQRGDALSEPSLDCPELGIDEFIDDGALLYGAASEERRQRQLQRCHDRLVEDGIDLTAYTSAASAADLADLRTALGYDAWNLYGLSYGSRLALTVMRDDPDGLRAVILDGAYPPNVNRYEMMPAGFEGAVAALLAACEGDESCAADHPDLEETLAGVLERGASDPLTVVAKNPADRSPVRVELTDGVLANGLFAALYDPESIRVLPFVLDQLARGNADAALPLAQRTLDTEGDDTEGLALSIECAEEVPFNDDAVIADARAAGAFARHLPAQALREECAIWGVPALDAAENAAVSSTVPTLIATGGFDPITPATWAEAAAVGLASQTSVVFPSAGHGAVLATWASTCPSFVAAEFLRDPMVAPDVGCAERMPPLDFLSTADVDPTSAIYHLDSDLVKDRSPAQLAIAGTTILAMAATLLYAIGYGLAWLVRRRGGAPEGAVLAASVAAGANLSFAGALTLVATTTEPVVLGFGLPPAAWPLFVLPFVALAATVVLVVLLVRAWIGGDGSTGDRVVLSVSAIASIGFAVWLLGRGLLTL